MTITRRDLLSDMAAGMTGLALADLIGREAAAEAPATAALAAE